MPGPYQATTVSRPPDGEGSSIPGPPGPFEFTVRGSLRALGDRISNDLEIVLLTGMLLALAAWFLAANRGEDERAFNALPAVQASRLLASSRTSAFDFVPAVAKAVRIPSQVGEQPAVKPRYDETVAPPKPGPEAASSVDIHALMAEPPVVTFDALGSLVLRGLPGNARLSAGARLSKPGAKFSDWAIAVGDLDDLIVYLPRNRPGAVRTAVDLHTRAGVKITTLNLELREDPAPPAFPTAKAPAERPVLNAKAVRPAGETGEKPKAKGTARRGAAVLKPAGGGASLAKPNVTPAMVKPAAGAVAVPLPPPASLFFKPDPKDSSLSGLSPTLREDPRFVTLRGLGMGMIEPHAGEGLSLTPKLP